jgi:AcrR family transcriptional regulator
MTGVEDFCSSRRDEIVEATRNLYETKGLDHTTVKDITEAIGVTRSLFYHYFENKDAVTEAVLDTYVDDFIQQVYYWNESRERYNVRKALQDCIKMLRRGVFDKDSFRIDLANNENASLYLRFYSRTAEALARYITDTTAVEYAQYHDIKIDHVYETFYMLIIGLVGFMRRYPDAPDELLEDLIAQTLRLDLSTIPADVASGTAALKARTTIEG